MSLQSDDRYQLIQQYRDELVTLTKAHNSVLNRLKMKEESEPIEDLIIRLSSDSFKVLVVGEFSRGKSTFINALLKSKIEILPTDILESTAVITEVKYDEENRAVMYYKPGFEVNGLKSIEVDINRLKELVTFHDGSSEDKEKQIHESPYEKLELFWPLELCKNGVDLIDSPGLNASDIGTQITTQYLSKVDAILFILTCNQLGTSAEIKTIETIRDYGFEDIFFICNFFDGVRDKEKDRVKKSALDKFGELTQRGGIDKGIFFISARDATDGYQEDDRELIESSGIIPLQSELELFLTTDKGRSKLISGERVLRSSINKARQIIPSRQKMLDTSLEDLNTRYDAAKEKLNKLEIERQEMVREVTIFRNDIKDLVRIKSREKIQKITYQVESWLESYEIKEPLNLISWDTFNIQTALERVINELTVFLVGQVERELKQWQKQELEIFLEERFQVIIQRLENRAKAFISDIDKIRLEIVYGDDIPSLNITADEANIHPLERIMAAAGGWLFGDFVSAGLGAAFGYKEMLKSLIPQIGIVAVTTLLAGFNPLILIPAIIAGGFIQGLIKFKGMNDKIKKQVGQKFADRLLSSKQPDEMAETIFNELGKFEEGIAKGLKQEISSVNTQTESILEEKRKGEQQAKHELMLLENISREVNEIDDELNELMRKISTI
jgi:GTPase SAR1 family protein